MRNTLDTTQNSIQNSIQNNGRLSQLFGISMICTALVACHKTDAPSNTSKATAQKPTPEVTVVVAQHQPVMQEVELAGRTAAYQTSPVIPQVSGILQKKLYQEGSTVHAGQPLFQVDSALLQSNTNAAKAAVQRNKVNLAALNVTGKRYKELVSIGGVSQLDYDTIRQQIAVAEADLAASQASLQNSQINLNYATVRAPISGQTSIAKVTVGALVTANQATPLLTIQQLDPMYVDMSQSSSDMLKLRQQTDAGTLSKPSTMPITLVLEDGSHYPLQGRLEFANSSVDPASGAITMRAVVPNPRGILLPSMYVKARIQQGLIKDAMLIPQQAVSHNVKGEATVLVVDKDGMVSERVIQTTATQGDQWIVTGGLVDGEQVIFEGTLKAKPKSKVKATIAKPITNTTSGAQG